MLEHTGKAGITAINSLKTTPVYLTESLTAAAFSIFTQLEPEEILTELRAENPIVCSAAISALKTRLSHSAFIDALIPLLDHREKTIRVNAVEAMGMLKDNRKTDFLLNMLDDPSIMVIKAAVYSLRYNPIEAVQKSLLSLLDHDNVTVRISVIEALGSIKIDGTIPQLAPFLENQAESLRKAAESSLYRLEWKPASDRENAAVDMIKGGLDRLLEKFNKYSYQEIEPLLKKALNWDYEWRDQARLAVLMAHNSVSFDDPCFEKIRKTLYYWATKADEEELVLGDQDYFTREISFAHERKSAQEFLTQMSAEK
ncbi:MAG: HEAT repeat domain-containing protein [Anaerolineales bacterium]|nr:HEAT repeat domain-containing protein [Anaerolineales bacterium]